MSKKFTDSNKWKQKWFRSLSPEMKAAWIYLCDNCDHAGVWEVDVDSLNFHVGSEITLDELLTQVNQDKPDRIYLFKQTRLVIKDYVAFQYGELQENSNPHKSVINKLKQHGLYHRYLENLEQMKERGKGEPTLDQGLTKGSLTLMEEEEEKDKEKNKEKVKEKKKENGENKKTQPFDLEALYKKYPRKEGKPEGLAALAVQIKTQTDYDDFSKAVDRYIEKIQADSTEKNYIKHFSTFVGSQKVPTWRECLEPDYGKSLLNFAPKQKTAPPPKSQRPDDLDAQLREITGATT